MEKADQVRLNHELLIWGGFTLSNGVWSYPDGITVDNGVPYFPGSLDECYKWLLPKIQERGVSTDLIAYEHEGYGILCIDVVHNEETLADIRDNEPAIALCLAIQKLIRSK